MTDVFSEEKRSYVMSRVSSKDTKPEKIVRSFLHRAGFRFRLHSPGLPETRLGLGKIQDRYLCSRLFLASPSRMQRTTTPATRREFWVEKFKKNVIRDNLNYKKLKEQGQSDCRLGMQA